MAYNNYFPAGYQPAQIYYPQAQPVQQNQIPAQAQDQLSDIKWIQGEASAKSYLVAPNRTVTLWDTESQTIYIKSADASGMPTMKILDYTMRDTMPQAKQIEAQEGFAKQSDVDYLKEQIDSLRAKFDDMDTGKKKEK